MADVDRKTQAVHMSRSVYVDARDECRRDGLKLRDFVDRAVEAYLRERAIRRGLREKRG